MRHCAGVFLWGEGRQKKHWYGFGGQNWICQANTLSEIMDSERFSQHTERCVLHFKHLIPIQTEATLAEAAQAF